MTGKRSVLLAVTAWVVVVALGSTMVWAVISRAGEGVVASNDPDPAADSSAADVEPSSPSPSPTPTDTPTSTSTPSPSRTPSPTGSPPTPAVERGTWEGAAGRVVVQCVGATISLVGAQPYGGYGIEVDARGPSRVEVEFERADDSDSRRRVRATCLDGLPRFEIDD